MSKEIQWLITVREIATGAEVHVTTPAAPGSDSLDGESAALVALVELLPNRSPIDVHRNDPTPRQTQLRYYGYEVVGSKLSSN